MNFLQRTKACIRPFLLKRSFRTSSVGFALSDFFDSPKNWKEATITSGRPWRQEELRLKSNTDLHKLWYVLLKERNMIMTMEEAYRHAVIEMPQPQRLEKVEESMENLLMVVEERNRALSELEDGHTSGPELSWDYDHMGRPVECYTSEHVLPKHLDADYVDRRDRKMLGPRHTDYLRLEREREIRRQDYERYQDALKRGKEALRTETLGNEE